MVTIFQFAFINPHMVFHLASRLSNSFAAFIEQRDRSQAILRVSKSGNVIYGSRDISIRDAFANAAAFGTSGIPPRCVLTPGIARISGYPLP